MERREHLCQKSGDVLLDGSSGIVTRVSRNDLTICIDQELLEVPGNIRSGNRAPEGHSGATETSSGKDECIHIITAIALGVASGILRNLDSASHPLEQRVGISTVDLDRGHNVELGLEAVAGTDILQGVQELIIILIGLVTKLVAGEAQNRHLVTKLVHNSIHCGQVGDSRASQRGNILDKDGLTSEVRQLHISTSQVSGSKILKVLRHCAKVSL